MPDEPAKNPRGPDPLKKPGRDKPDPRTNPVESPDTNTPEEIPAEKTWKPA